MPESSHFLLPKQDWCPFRRITSPALASMVAERCLHSLDTLEFMGNSAGTNFALIELEHPGLWRWAIVNSRGLILDEGHESLECAAQKSAEIRLHRAIG